MFDFQIWKWEPLPDLNEGRTYHSSTAFNCKTMYVFCGINESVSELSTIERWAVGEDKWTPIQYNNDNFFMKQYIMSVKVNDKFILIFGGRNDNDRDGNNKTNYEFYPGTNQIKKVEEMTMYFDKYGLPDPIYDEYTNTIYAFAFDYQNDVPNILKFGQDQKWSFFV